MAAEFESAKVFKSLRGSQNDNCAMHMPPGVTMPDATFSTRPAFCMLVALSVLASLTHGACHSKARGADGFGRRH